MKKKIDNTWNPSNNSLSLGEIIKYSNNASIWYILLTTGESEACRNTIINYFEENSNMSIDLINRIVQNDTKDFDEFDINTRYYVSLYLSRRAEETTLNLKDPKQLELLNKIKEAKDFLNTKAGGDKRISVKAISNKYGHVYYNDNISVRDATIRITSDNGYLVGWGKLQ